MATITESEALRVLSLDHLKASLRIPPANIPADPAEAAEAVASEAAHDDYLKAIITDAVSYVSKSTGAEGDDLLPLRPAAVSITRELYDGSRQIRPSAAHNTWMNVYRSYKKAE